MGFGLGLAQGAIAGQERVRNRRAKVFDAFNKWKQDNPYATAADFQGAVRAIGGGDFAMNSALPGQQAIQRMSQQNEIKKKRAEEQQRFADTERQVSMQSSLLGLVGSAIDTYGDKADANQIASQFGLDPKIVQPAVEHAQAKRAAQAAKDAKANSIKAYDAYSTAALAAQQNYGTPDEVHQAGLAAAKRRAAFEGFELDLGSLNAPSSFQQATSSANTDYQVTFDAQVEAQGAIIADEIVQNISSNPMLMDQLTDDVDGAIAAATAGQYQAPHNQRALDQAMAGVKKRLAPIAEQARTSRAQSERTAASSVYSAINEGGVDTDLVLGQEDAVRGAMIDQLVASNDIPRERAIEVVDDFMLDQQDQLTTAHDARYNDPQGLEEFVQQGRLSAGDFLEGKFDRKNGTVLVGSENGPSTFVGELNVGFIEQLMADKLFYDQEEQVRYFRTLAQAADTASFNSAQELDDAAMKLYEDEIDFPQSARGLLSNPEILQQQQDNFASTAEMGQADLDRAAFGDTNYRGVDITEAAIRRAVELEEDARKVVLNGTGGAGSTGITGTLVAAIQDAEDLRDFVLSGQTMRIVDFGELPPEHRLARGVRYDRSAHVAIIDQRIADLRKRQAIASKQAGYQTSLSGAASVSNFGDKPLPLANFVTNTTQVQDPKFRNRLTTRTRDVSFSEAMNVSRDALDTFGDGVEAAMQSNKQAYSGMPDLVQAVSSGLNARDPYVVKALSDALEAYDFMVAFGQDQISRGSIGAGAFNKTMDEMGFAPRAGTLDAAKIDEAARRYAKQFVDWHLSEHPNYKNLQQQINELILMESNRGGLEEDAGANYRAALIELPRARSTYGSGG